MKKPPESLTRLVLIGVVALVAALLVNHLIGHTPGWVRLQNRLSTFRSETRTEIEVTADDVRELSVGMDVKYRGYPIGVIHDIKYRAATDKFEVKLRLHADERVCKRARFERASVVLERPLVGPTIIELDGPPKAERDTQAVAIARLERAPDLFANLQPTLTQLPRTLASIDTAAQGLHDDLTPVLAELKTTLTGLRATVTNLGTESTRTFGEATTLLKDFQLTAAALNVRSDPDGRQTHLAGMLTKLDASAERLDGFMKRIDPKTQALLTGLKRNTEDLHATTGALHDYIYALHHRGLLMSMFGGGGEARRPSEQAVAQRAVRQLEASRKERKIADR